MKHFVSFFSISNIRMYKKNQKKVKNFLDIYNFFVYFTFFF